MNFTKMHGLGNDYVYVNGFEEKVSNPEELAIAISNRYFGVGADGLILINPSSIAEAQMRIFNADGSEAEMCGNGIRCAAKYACERKLIKADKPFSLPGSKDSWPGCQIETGNGVLTVGVEIDNNQVSRVCVNMGQPELAPGKIGVLLKGENIIESPIEICGKKLMMTCVSMGNPHAIFFCDDIDAIELEKLGPAIENHPLFPNRVNAHFVTAKSQTEFTMRTWERGSGITLACGTGACASCVALVLTGQIQRNCIAHLPGGDLDLNWSQYDNCVYMTGPAVEVFHGSFNWPD
ncbi:MAG: diaminopimelate epimerase [Planctomycetes bacterium]|nr:diaminopimelate epimerase [Planctomycetota bacterium]